MWPGEAAGKGSDSWAVAGSPRAGGQKQSEGCCWNSQETAPANDWKIAPARQCGRELAGPHSRLVRVWRQQGLEVSGLLAARLAEMHVRNGRWGRGSTGLQEQFYSSFNSGKAKDVHLIRSSPVETAKQNLQGPAVDCMVPGSRGRPWASDAGPGTSGDLLSGT